MFYKVGFYVLLILLLGMILFFMSMNPMKTEGAASWIDLYSNDSAATIKFLKDNFGIEVVNTSKSLVNTDYSVIKANKYPFPFAGVMQIPKDNTELLPHASIYLTVKDYDKMHERLVKAGAKPVLDHKVAGGMKFGIYIIPGGLDIGIAQWGTEFK